MPQSRQDESKHCRVPGNPLVAHTVKRGRAKKPRLTHQMLPATPPSLWHTEVFRYLLRGCLPGMEELAMKQAASAVLVCLNTISSSAINSNPIILNGLDSITGELLL